MNSHKPPACTGHPQTEILFLEAAAAIGSRRRGRGRLCSAGTHRTERRAPVRRETEQREFTDNQLLNLIISSLCFGEQPLVTEIQSMCVNVQ